MNLHPEIAPDRRLFADSPACRGFISDKALPYGRHAETTRTISLRNAFWVAERLKQIRLRRPWSAFCSRTASRTLVGRAYEYTYTTIQGCNALCDSRVSHYFFRLVRFLFFALPSPSSSEDQLADHHLINHHSSIQSRFCSRIELTCVRNIYQPSQLLNSPPLNERSSRNICWKVC